MSHPRFDALFRPLTESRRSVVGSAVATAALLGLANPSAAKKKPKKKGKGGCAKGLKKVGGRCARTCQDSSDCGDAGYCMPTFDDGAIGAKVCALIGGLLFLESGEQCDLLGERGCNRPGECSKNETCVIQQGCLVTFCAATAFP